jgi:GNAT superfamily N-acetyltransferase
LNDIIIRKAKESDYQDICGLVIELYDTLDVKDGMEEHLDQEKFEDILDDPKISVLVAELKNSIVGYLTINFNKSLLDIGSTAIIDELMVTKEHRGKGVGTLLVNYAIEISQHMGCSEIGVGTEYTNSQAREFYKRQGFKEIGVIFEMVLK